MFLRELTSLDMAILLSFGVHIFVPGHFSATRSKPRSLHAWHRGRSDLSPGSCSHLVAMARVAERRRGNLALSSSTSYKHLAQTLYPHHPDHVTTVCRPDRARCSTQLAFYPSGSSTSLLDTSQRLPPWWFMWVRVEKLAGLRHEYIATVVEQ